MMHCCIESIFSFSSLFWEPSGAPGHKTTRNINPPGPVLITAKGKPQKQFTGRSKVVLLLGIPLVSYVLY